MLHKNNSYYVNTVWKGYNRTATTEKTTAIYRVMITIPVTDMALERHKNSIRKNNHLFTKYMQSKLDCSFCNCLL